MGQVLAKIETEQDVPVGTRIHNRERNELSRITVSVTRLETKERVKNHKGDDLHFGQRVGYCVRLFAGGENGGLNNVVKEFDVLGGKPDLDARLVEEFRALFIADINCD
jgi:hypothetical protein